MITEEKIKSIKKQLKRGVPEGELRAQLLAEGYKDEDLKEVFKPARPDMRSWYLISGFIVLFIGIASFPTHSILWGIPMFSFVGIPLPIFLSGLLFYEYYRQDKKFKEAKDKS